MWKSEPVPIHKTPGHILLQMNRNAARAFLAYRVERIVAARRAIRLVINVSVVAEQVLVSGDCFGRLVIIQRPRCLCAVNILAVDGARLLLRFFDRVVDAWDGNCREQTDDGYDDHDFNESESNACFCVHGICSDLDG